jgi:hypothetical protein
VLRTGGTFSTDFQCKSVRVSARAKGDGGRRRSAIFNLIGHEPQRPTLRILAQLEKHFAAGDYSPADTDRWRELKRHIARMKEGLDWARIELDRTAPDASKALRQVGLALGRVGIRGGNAMRQWGVNL